MSSITEEVVKHLHISLQELSDATNTFSERNIIAKGGFGNVYRGVSKKHGDIAVKKLTLGRGIYDQGDNEFRTEIALLSVYKHENIVSLVGFCDEEGQKILVYKFEKNGSLDRWLRKRDLTWTQRLRICLDAARGLQYLHDDIEPKKRILHCDVKSPNILLDENWRAKIADFGLSTFGPANMESTYLIRNPCGTIGYIDPEYQLNHYLTQKSDVYSFGVVLFEVLCGRLTRVPGYRDKREFLTNLVKIYWKKKKLHEIIYSDIQKQIKRSSFLTFTTIAYQCLMGANERPTMMNVVEQLQKALDNQLASNGQWSDQAIHHSGKSAESLAPSSFSKPWTCDVYISYRQEDICETFVDNLYSALAGRQVITKKTHHHIQHHKSPKRLIEYSSIAVIIFSPNYASTTAWCMSELVSIMQNRDAGGQMVIPICCGVEPSKVSSHMLKYCEEARLASTNVSTRQRLAKEAVYLSRLDVKWDMVNGNEWEYIQNLVGQILRKILGLMQHSEEGAETKSANTGLIGIEARKQELISLLDVGTGGVRKVGISGVWGSGKTTLASSTYDEISDEFEGCCFIKDVKYRSMRYGLKTLQEEILSNVVKLKVRFENLTEGLTEMERNLCQKRVLIVLDNVDHAEQLEMLVGSDNWFGDGSRIIFTSRNKELVNARSSVAHNVRMLDNGEAVELFRRRAFGGKSKPSQNFEQISRYIVSKFVGHPSALIHLGSFLHGKDVNEWTIVQGRIMGLTVGEILKEFRTRDDGLARNRVPRFFT